MTNKEAIEALSHCMVEHKCEDGMYGHCEGCNQRIALDKAIESLKDSWIPCSERLPIKGETVLVCYSDGFMNTDLIHEHQNELAWLCAFHNSEKPIAWMPLPKPYKEKKKWEKT